MGEYDVEYMDKLIWFGVKYWLKFEEDNIYKLVIFYKNYGFYFGGSLKYFYM